MSAGVCGKRVGFEEIFGSSPKRFRCSGFESPNPSSDPGSRPDDRVSTFSALDPELRTSVVRNHGNKNEDFKESSNAFFSEPEERNKQHNFDSVRTGNCTDETATCSQISGYKGEYSGNAVDSPKWTDLFVQEMASATNMDDAKVHAARILQAFEGSFIANKRAAEEEHFRSLLDNNQILRKAVAIQHERNVEQERKEREV